MTDPPEDVQRLSDNIDFCINDAENQMELGASMSLDQQRALTKIARAGREVAVKQAEELAALRARLAAAEALVPHPGDGSCDNCGLVPSVDIPTRLCPECVDGVARALAAESSLLALRTRHAEVVAAARAFKDVVDAVGGLDCNEMDRALVDRYIDASEALDALLLDPAGAPIADVRAARPKVVCLCGSTRFFRSFMEWYGRLTDEGCIVLTIGRIVGQSEGALGEARKVALDELHKRKIDLADEVFVLDVGGYTGTSTKGEIAHAEATGKPVRYLSREFPEYVEPDVPEFVRAMIERDRTDAPAREEPTCRVCRGTGRDPMSDNVNWLPCSNCAARSTR